METLGQVGVDNVSSFIGPVNKEAQAWADEHAGDLISGLDDATHDEVRRIIADGLRDNLTDDEIADNLQSAYAFSDDRAELIATTETQIANGQGSVEGLRQAAKHGLKVKKEWICDPDPCPICEANQDQGAIPVDATFDSGDDAEPAHPNCECFTQGVVEEEDETDDE